MQINITNIKNIRTKNKHAMRKFKTKEKWIIKNEIKKLVAT